MKKNLSIKHLILLTIFFLNLITIKSQVYAVTTQNLFLNEANTLFDLSLFKGTTNGYELDRVSNRAEAAIMLVRLLGVEEQAYEQASGLSHPFTDVPYWAEPHVAYLYNTGLTKGMSDTYFGSTEPIIDIQFTTMLLRALGYSEEENDFLYSNSINFAKTIGLLKDEDMQYLNQLNGESLIRSYLVKMSYNSLFTNMKDSEYTLLMDLSSRQVVPEDKAKLLLLAKEEEAKEEEAKEEEAKEEEAKEEEAKEEETKEEKVKEETQEEMRAVWLSYIELQEIFKSSKSEAEFKNQIQNIFDDIKNTGLNSVIVQVRAFGDAFYESDLFPWSYIITGEEGISPGYDPLKIMIEQAHSKGLHIEAWLNPFRIRTNKSISLSDNNIAKDWIDDGSNRVLKIGNGLYYNPASVDVQRLIVEGVLEIINNYDVDGIHFDDYFYPSASLEYDLVDYNNYSGNLTHEQWRRNNIDILIKNIYASIKSYDSSIRFGISPQASIENNTNQQYINVQNWLESDEYIDYICPQVYFGFENERLPFDETVDRWNNMIKNENIDLYIGLAGYKVGREDKWAGKGKYEWIEEEEILKRMVLYSRQKENYKGFVIFRYGTLWDQPEYIAEKTENELNRLQEILK